MNTSKYLERLNLEYSDIIPNLENLKLLQRRHLLSIPFENLDIHWKVPIILDIQKFYKKIIEHGRGGFCYELNGLFNELLNEIGYKTKIISARVSDGRGRFGNEYDHLAILTEIDEEEYLTDVGFGDFTAEPLSFVLDFEQEDRTGLFLINKFDDEYFAVLKKDKNSWNCEYIFKYLARNLSEFEEMCDYHQSGKSHFSKGKICSVLTTNGRNTLTDKKLIEDVNGKKSEFEVKSQDTFINLLEKEFNIKK